MGLSRRGTVEVEQLSTLCLLPSQTKETEFRGKVWSFPPLLGARGSSGSLRNVIARSSHISPGAQEPGEVLCCSNSDCCQEGLKTGHLRVDDDREAVFWRIPRRLFNIHASFSNLLICRLQLSSPWMPPGSPCCAMPVKYASLLCLSSESWWPRLTC